LAFPLLSLAGHSVELNGPAGGDIGTVTFTSVNGHTFQGTYVAGTALTKSFFFDGTYTATTTLGPIPITGTLGTPQASGGSFTWSISFSGTFTGTSTECYIYTDTNGNSQDEQFTVPDTQTVSFSGTMTGNVSTLSFSGTINENVSANWIGVADQLPPTDPNHHFGPGEGPFDPTNPEVIAAGMLGIQFTLDTGISNRSVMGNLM
jgi:hypothetical protein